MKIRKAKILITGGAGFLGSEFTRQLARRGCHSIIVDKLTYAGDLERLSEVDGRYKFYKIDICDRERLDSVFKKENPQIILNFSAETHVDRSIFDSEAFVETNIKGTHVLLDMSRKHRVKRFIQISTDEVYGEIEEGRFNEDSPLRPNNPYAASKAAADLLIRSYIKTYTFPAVIIRPCNNYGPWQHPEKLIPLTILKIIKNEKIPIYDKGRDIREWLFVSDCAKGILQILETGRDGEVYNLGSLDEKENIEVVSLILEIFRRNRNIIEFVKDRPGHDRGYRLNLQKVFNEIGWRPDIKFEKGIRFTISWFLRHRNWLMSKR